MASALRERILQAVYATGSRGENCVEDRTGQQRKAAFAFTLCHLASLTREA